MRPVAAALACLALSGLLPLCVRALARQPGSAQGEQQAAERDSVPFLADLSGVYAGTWTRLVHGSQQPAAAGAATSAPPHQHPHQRGSGGRPGGASWPALLTRGWMGRLQLRISAGPFLDKGEDHAGIEGVLSLADGSLARGAIKHLTVSGFTRLQQTLHAPKQTVHALATPSTPIFMPRSSSGGGGSGGSGGSSGAGSLLRMPGWVGWWLRHHQQQHQQQGDGSAAQPRTASWLLPFYQPAAEMLGRQGSTAQDGAAGASATDACRFRLELSVAPAEDGNAGAAASSDQASREAPAMQQQVQPAQEQVQVQQQRQPQQPQQPQQTQQQQDQRQRWRWQAVGVDSWKHAAQQQQQQQQQQLQQLQHASRQPGHAPKHHQQHLHHRQHAPDQTGSSGGGWHSVQWSWQAYLEGGPQPQLLLQRQVPTGGGAVAAARAQHAGVADAGAAAAAAGPGSHRGVRLMSVVERGQEEFEAPETAAIPTAAEPEVGLSGAALRLQLPLQPGADPRELSGRAPLRALQTRTFPGLNRQWGPPAAALAGAAGRDGSERSSRASGSSSGMAAAGLAAAAAAAAEAAASSMAAAGYRVRQVVVAAASADPDASSSDSSSGDARPGEPTPVMMSARALIAAGPAPAADAASGNGTPAPATASARSDSQRDSSSGSPLPPLIARWLLPCSHGQQRQLARCQHVMANSELQQRLMVRGILLSDNCNVSYTLSAVELDAGGQAVATAVFYALLALGVCLVQVVLLRSQAAAVAASPAAALKVSLVGVCAGAQLDACMSMAHLVAALASPDISMPLLVVAAAQFALFAGADMALLLHVWRAHTQHQQRSAQRARQALRGRPSASALGGSASPFGLTPHDAHAGVVGLLLSVQHQVEQQLERLRLGGGGGGPGGSSVELLLSGLLQLAVGRSLVMLYVRLYLVLLAGITVAWLLASQLPLLLLLAYSMWVPQLLHNISTTARRPLHVGYVLNSSFARLLLPAYTFGCSQNLLQVPAQPWLASALVGWVGLQVALLLLQHFVHPHVLLPRAWVPVRYDYHRLELPWQFRQAAAAALGMAGGSCGSACGHSCWDGADCCAGCISNSCGHGGAGGWQQPAASSSSSSSGSIAGGTWLSQAGVSEFELSSSSSSSYQQAQQQRQQRASQLGCSGCGAWGGCGGWGGQCERSGAGRPLHCQHGCCSGVPSCHRQAYHPHGSSSGNACGGCSSGGCSPALQRCSSTLGSCVGAAEDDDGLHDVIESYNAATGQGVVECVICMAGVQLLPASERVVTPCAHFYHRECLASWMAIKAECPQCRHPLPPL